MSDPTIAIKNEKPSDIIEDDSDDETEGADEVVDSDSVEEKTVSFNSVILTTENTK